jgi:hypothetical protein
MFVTFAQHGSYGSHECEGVTWSEIIHACVRWKIWVGSKIGPCLSDVCQCLSGMPYVCQACLAVSPGVIGRQPPPLAPKKWGWGGGGLGFGLGNMKNGPTWISVLQCHPNHTCEGVRTIYLSKRIQGTKCDVIPWRGWDSVRPERLPTPQKWLKSICGLPFA